MSVEGNTFHITKRPVTVKANEKTKPYDNDPSTDPALDAEVEGNVEGETISYTLSREAGQEAGDYAITVTAGENPNYEVSVEGNTFHITPLEGVTVTVTEHSGRYTYNAAARKVTGYDVEISNPLYKESDFTFSGKDSVEGTNAGTYAMELKPEDFTNTNANFANVAFVIKDGTLVIDPKAVKITANDNGKTYGDEEPVLTATTEGLEGSDYIVSRLSREDNENVGTYTITVEPVANPNYEIETVSGTFTIKPKQITVTANDSVKVFGKADPELSATITGLVEGDGEELIDYSLSREEGEDVGEYVISAEGEAEQGNYTVTYEPGKLTIVPESTVIVTIRANNGTFKYDGQAKDLSGYSVETNNELYTEADFTFSGNSELKGVNAGVYRTAMKAEDFTNNNDNFDSVIFEVINGRMDITRRNVTLTSGSATKPYDGTALVNEQVVIGGEGFAEGEGANITVTGRITQEGTDDNTFEYTLNANTLAQNYNIRTVTGTLTITKGETHKLTITYVNENGKILKVFTRDYAFGEDYSVASPSFTGMRPDTAKVSGTMGGEDIAVTVTYSPILNTLTVKYVSVTDGRQVAPSVVMELKQGERYTVFTKTVPGYTALKSEVSGVMPGSNRQITVFMVPDGTTGNFEHIEIDDYGTPLGVPESILGGGEIIE